MVTHHHALILSYLERADISNPIKLGSLAIYSHFIAVLLEIWRSERHNLRFSTSECNITLEDVSMILGLLVNGKVANSNTEI